MSETLKTRGDTDVDYTTMPGAELAARARSSWDASQHDLPPPFQAGFAPILAQLIARVAGETSTGGGW